MSDEKPAEEAKHSIVDTIKEGLSAAGSAVGGAAGKVVDVTKSAVVATGEGISNVAHKAGDVVGLGKKEEAPAAAADAPK